MSPEQLLPLIEKHISEQRFGEQPPTLYEPIRYIMKLGGKRMRPMLTCLAYQAYRQEVAPVIPFAVAVEVFHNFTLLHDDIMDKAPLRRGKKTVHEKWNQNVAILSGDVMLVKAYELFEELEPAQLKAVLPLFNRTAAEVCEGQQWDMDFETRNRVSEAEYIEMIRLKTAVLLGFSLELGATLAGAPANERKALRDFGTNMGIAFQLKDDLLDVYGDQKKFGKQVGGDILANKKTFLLIRALVKARGKSRTELQGWLKKTKYKPVEKVKAVTALYNQLGIPQETQTRIDDFFQLALRSLEELPSEKARPLEAFARYLADRQS